MREIEREAKSQGKTHECGSLDMCIPVSKVLKVPWEVSVMPESGSEFQWLVHIQTGECRKLLVLGRSGWCSGWFSLLNLRSCAYTACAVVQQHDNYVPMKSSPFLFYSVWEWVISCPERTTVMVVSCGKWPLKIIPTSQANAAANLPVLVAVWIFLVWRPPEPRYSIGWWRSPEFQSNASCLFQEFRR